MNVSEFWSAHSRRLLVAVALAALVCSGSSVLAQDPAPAAAPPPDLLKLSSDYVLIMNQVKADKVADFEASWDKIRAGLAKSTKDDVKQLGESLKIFKIDAPPQDTPGGKSVTYIFQLFPPVKTLSYQPTEILFTSGAFERPEADAIFEKLKDCYISINPIPLAKIGG
jgi:hypothetical protein